mgnify:CR=1 FL=1
MAQEYDNKNTWVLFKNDKGDNEKRPDYTGTEVDENGVEHKIAGWIRVSKKTGEKFIALRIWKMMFLSNLLLAISLIIMFITALLSWMFVCIFLITKGVEKCFGLKKKN